MEETVYSLEHTPYEPVARYFLEISFDGTNYSGWQYQPHSYTVQQAIQERLHKIYNAPVNLIGSSRTDTGVHALGFAASFLVPARPVLEPDKLQRAMNKLLPPDIKLRTVKEVPLSFHARHHSLGKAYTYVLNLGEPSPFLNRYSWRPPHKMDVDAIRASAAELTGTHDYSSFVVERSMIDEAVRTIYRIDVQEFGKFCTITYVGNGFLYKMIRCLTGMLEAAGAGKATPADTRHILECRDRTMAPETAPGCGLYLMKVFYDPESRTGYHLDSLPFLV